MKKLFFMILIALLAVLTFVVSSMPIQAQDIFPTSTPSPDFSPQTDAFNTPTPAGPIIVNTPDAPATLKDVLDHGIITMVSKLEGCDGRVENSGEDCTTVQGHAVVAVKHPFKNQYVRVSADSAMVIVPSCPTDPAERALVDMVNSPVQYVGLVKSAVAKLKALGATETCFFQPNSSNITGTFYHSIIVQITQDNEYFAIVLPHGGDITSFVPHWASEPTSEQLDLVVSVALERVVTPPEMVEKFAPDATNVPNCAGSLLDMALSVNPNATTVEELTAALRQFVGKACDLLNLTVGKYGGKSASYYLRGVYVRNALPAYTDLSPYLLQPIVTITPNPTVAGTAVPTLTMTPSS